MRWREVTLSVEAELAEAVADVLARYAPSGAAVSIGPEAASGGPLLVQAYFPDDDRAAATEQAIREAVWHLSQIRPIPEPAFRLLDELDWAEAWKANYHPLPIGDRLIVIPSWERLDPGSRVPVYLDPGMAFGTGAHPTTRLCLLAIEQNLRPGDLMIDLGCGSGILAVAAARLGAWRVLACDTDAEAVSATRRSAEANGVTPSIDVFPGSLPEALSRLDDLGRRADLVAANILAPVLIDLLAHGLARTLSDEGLLVVSGILTDQEHDVAQAALDAGLHLRRSQTDGDWRALWLTKRNAAPVHEAAQ